MYVSVRSFSCHQTNIENSRAYSVGHVFHFSAQNQENNINTQSFRIFSPYRRVWSTYFFSHSLTFLRIRALRVPDPLRATDTCGGVAGRCRCMANEETQSYATRFTRVYVLRQTIVASRPCERVIYRTFLRDFFSPFDFYFFIFCCFFLLGGSRFFVSFRSRRGDRKYVINPLRGLCSPGFRFTRRPKRAMIGF